MRSASRTASWAVWTTPPFGTGRPARSSSVLVRALLLAVSVAMCEVRPVMLARICCWYLP